MIQALIRKIFPMLILTLVSGVALGMALGLPSSALAKKTKVARKPDLGPAFFKKFKLPPDAIGYILMDPVSGKVLQSHNADTAFIPASAIKTEAALSGLMILGPTYRYETKLYMTGTVEKGVLKGTVFLLGNGDPSLTTDELEGFVERLRQMGITRVAGGFVFDEHLLPSKPEIDQKHYREVAYNPGLGALSLNFNRIKLKWQRGKGKNRNQLSVEAVARTDKGQIPVTYLSFDWIAKKTAAPHGLIYDDTGDKQRWLFMKKIKRKGEIWVPVKRPGYFTAHVFRNLADKQGIALPEPTAGRVPRGARLIGTVRSKPLVQLTKRMMYYSNNMMAEMIGLTAAQRLTSAGLSVEDSALALNEWLKAKIGGTGWDKFRVLNHSGLSTKTRISPRQMARLLAFAKKQKFDAWTFEDVLKTYHINSRKNRLPKHVSVRAKTGTINYARSVAGYVHTKKKRTLIFAVFISDFQVREARAAAGKKYRIPGRRRWMSRARHLRRAIVRRFAEQY